MKSDTFVIETTKNGNSISITIPYNVRKNLDLELGDKVKVTLEKIEEGKDQ